MSLRLQVSIDPQKASKAPPERALRGFQEQVFTKEYQYKFTTTTTKERTVNTTPQRQPP